MQQIIQNIFPQFPKDSKTWIFGAEQALTDTQQDFIQTQLTSFLDQWQAHGTPLHGAVTILFNQFIIISVNEELSHASGCSIDALTHFIQLLENKIHLSLTNRMKVSFLDITGIQTLDLPLFKKEVKSGTLNDAFVFNTSLSRLNELKESFLLPIQESWAAPMLPEK